MSGYHNPDFDRMADQSTTEMDPSNGRQLVMECRN
jgi:hypothetical protein